jgi:hypothetical protein
MGVGIGQEGKRGPLLCRSLDYQILSERVTSIYQYKTTIFVTTAIKPSSHLVMYVTWGHSGYVPSTNGSVITLVVSY